MIDFFKKYEEDIIIFCLSSFLLLFAVSDLEERKPEHMQEAEGIK